MCNKGDYCKFYHDKGEAAVAPAPVAPPVKTTMTPTGSAGVSQPESATLPIFGQGSSELAAISTQQPLLQPIPEILPPGIANAIVGPVPTIVVDETN